MKVAAWITARDLVGGLILGIATGTAVDELGKLLPLPLRRSFSALAALGIIGVAGALWARHMAHVAGAPPPSRRREIVTAVSFGAAIVAVGGLLAAIEPAMVARGGESGLQIHVVYSLLFVPATFIVATVGALALGSMIGAQGVEARFAIVTGVCAALAFLVVDLSMDAIGWRVGAPDAGRRATMLVVTFVSMTAAALSAGGAIGWAIPSSRRT